MKTTHEFELTSKCPVDGTDDLYFVTVETSRLIPVETILDAAKKATVQPDFQETVTRKLADELCTKVTTVGTHSGVKTTCEALP